MALPSEERHLFLSEGWLDAARQIREEHSSEPVASQPAIRMNQVITEVPFGDGTVLAHMDTTDGRLEMDSGLLPDADLTVTMDYATAHAILVDGNPQAGMTAFMAGKIKVQGDMTKMMGMSQGAPDPTQA